MRSGAQTRTSNPSFGDGPEIRHIDVSSRRLPPALSNGNGICRRCSELVFSPCMWAHLLGETIDPSYPPDNRSDYHLSFAIDREASAINLESWCNERAFRMFRSSPIPKKRGPVVDIYIEAGEILRSREQSCGFCTVVAHLDPDGSLLVTESEKRIIRLQAIWPEKASGLACPFLLEVGLHAAVSGGGHTWPLALTCDDSGSKGTMVGGDNASAEIRDSLDAALNWLRACQSKHPECSHNEQAGMPRRVLDLDDAFKDGRIRLVESPTLRSCPYAMLSYVWGTARTLQLTEENRERLMTGIGTEKLPQTIVDAVYITHALGIRYLWVDALCILQDSAQDKGDELPLMSQYYTNSCIVISASGAVDTGMGFLHLIPTLEMTYNERGPESRPFRLPIHLPKGSISASVNTRPTMYNFEREPLNKRCWTLQESVVPRRLLNIPQSGGIIMQCRTNESIAGIVVSNPYSETPDYARLGRISQSAQSPDQVSELWSNMVEEYTRRSLSYRMDMLLAIGALAREFSTHHAPILGEYKAGLWAHHLRSGLLWRTNGTDLPTKSTQQTEYVGPSWSWASTAMPVTFETQPEIYIISPYSGEDSWEDMFKTRWLAEVISCDSSLRTAQDPFGAVTAGTLVMKAPLRSLHPRRQTRRSDGSQISDPDLSKYPPTFALDAIECEAEVLTLDHPFDARTETGIAWLHSRQWHWLAIWWAGRGRARGLILEEQAPDVFKRVGFACFHIFDKKFDRSIDLQKEPVVRIV